jgi:Uri superfamily endonuclease
MLKGIYTLVITLTTSTTISVGKLGNISFPKGYYAYVGSALNNLEARIARHLKEKKLLHWHIDYFLQKAQVEEVVWGSTDKNEECAVAGHHLQVLLPVPRFGSSDCRCRSHLFFSGDKTYLRKTVRDSFAKRDLLFSAMDIPGIKKALGGAGFMGT